MNELWGKIDLDRWQDTPYLHGRPAVEQDVKDGRAVFFIQDAEEIGVVFEDIGLPRCAILSEDSHEVPVIIVQSERLGENHTIGYRSLNCGNGMVFARLLKLSFCRNQMRDSTVTPKPSLEPTPLILL